MGLASPYWQKIWTCDMLLQNLFHEFSTPNRRNGVCLWQQTSCRKQSQKKTLWGKSSRATRRGSTGITQRQNVSLCSRSLLIPWGQRKCTRCGQSHAHCFLWYGGRCSLWVRSTRPNCKPTVFFYKFWNIWDLLFLARGHRNGQQGPGRYITTMHHHTQNIPSRYYWQVMAFLSFTNHPTPLTWLCVTFGYSPN